MHIPINHATAINIAACLNQLACAGLSYAIEKEQIPQLKNIDFSNLQKENMLITEVRERFRRPMPTGSEVYGTIRLEDWRDDEKMLRGYGKFEFENRSCIGEFNCVLIL